jgi:hypothetical protein
MKQAKTRKRRPRLTPRRPGSPYGTDLANQVCRVACPTCQAPAHAPCVTASGDDANTPHSTRGHVWAQTIRAEGDKVKDYLP